MDPRFRLKRTVPGESLLNTRLSGHIVTRLDAKPRSTERTHRHREPWQYKIREVRRKIEPAPYAPQLMRIIKRRYSESGIRPRRAPSGQWTPEPRARAVFGHGMRDAVQDATPPAHENPIRTEAGKHRPQLEMAMILRQRAAALEQP